MTRRTKIQDSAVLRIDNDVVRQIRQHARSENKTEVCGILLGRVIEGSISISARIAGENAAQGGAHVTFTQDTWEHIYRIKDKEYPTERILGWYHSHPGFGIFLSEHDTFIHQNFFSSPQQVAWVYDPLSDEEGCFGWQAGRIIRLAQIGIVDSHGGEQANAVYQLGSTAGCELPVETSPMSKPNSLPEQASDEQSLQTLVAVVLSHLAAALLGFALAYFLFPKLVLMAVPVDPRTGEALGPLVEVNPQKVQDFMRTAPSADENKKGDDNLGKSAQPAGTTPKAGDEHR